MWRLDNQVPGGVCRPVIFLFSTRTSPNLFIPSIKKLYNFTSYQSHKSPPRQNKTRQRSPPAGATIIQPEPRTSFKWEILLLKSNEPVLEFYLESISHFFQALGWILYYLQFLENFRLRAGHNCPLLFGLEL